MPMPFHKYAPYATVDLPDRTWPDVVLTSAPIWCSTDLRDGNQALVNPMDTHRKRRFFALLLELGFWNWPTGHPSHSSRSRPRRRRLPLAASTSRTVS